MTIEATKRQFSLNEFEIGVRDGWRAGADTKLIAEHWNTHESNVYNTLHRLRTWARIGRTEPL